MGATILCEKVTKRQQKMNPEGELGDLGGAKQG
jgi:hypothetical protein